MGEISEEGLRGIGGWGCKVWCHKVTGLLGGRAYEVTSK